jgi:hypothetical protein
LARIEDNERMSIELTAFYLIKRRIAQPRPRTHSRSCLQVSASSQFGVGSEIDKDMDRRGDAHGLSDLRAGFSEFLARVNHSFT